jgi:hypothetical protein
MPMGPQGFAGLVALPRIATDPELPWLILPPPTSDRTFAPAASGILLA